MASAADLIRTVGLRVGGTVRWGERIPSPGPGVYIVSMPEPMADAPIDAAALQAWIHRLPGMTVDRAAATVASLEARLRSFWIPETSIVYIGLAGISVAGRVADFYRTPLGARAPHAGGHWLKTLVGLDTFLVTWAESAAPGDDEDALLRAFADALPKAAGARLPAGPILPFANLETGGKIRKAHGISGSRDPRTPSLSDPPVPVTRPKPATARASSRPTAKASLAEINAAIQRLACAHPDRRVTAVEAGAELDRLDLVRDSPTRRGKPVRDLLRAGAIDHAYQEGGRFWFIDCADRGHP